MMSDDHSSRGYVKDASYPITYFHELAPVWLNYVAALGGVAPRGLDEKFSYLELGSGPGFSTVIHAACYPGGEFHACDFNTESVATGERYADDLSIQNVFFHGISFAELLERDLPEFDFIVLHGVYSWVGPDARQTIRQLIKKRLKPGGLVYLGYNCMPGWTLEVPLRRLLIELTASMSGDSPQKAADAVRVLKRLGGAELKYFQTNPAAMTAIDSYLRSPSNYLAHEFLNETWEPLYSIDVADEMTKAELTYLGSATLVDNHEALVIDSSASGVIADLQTSRLQQLTTDFAVDRRFRRDVFVRADSHLEKAGVGGHLGAVVVGCLNDPEAIRTTVQVPRGQISFQADFIRELRQLLSGGSTTLMRLVAALGGKSRDSAEITRNLLYLLASGELVPFSQSYQPHEKDGRFEFSGERTKTMLSYIAHENETGQIASEVVGSGVAVSPRDALAILEYLAAGEQGETDSVLRELIPRLRRFGLIV